MLRCICCLLAMFALIAVWKPSEVSAQGTGTVSVELIGTGSVTSDPLGINCPPQCEVAFSKKETVVLYATAQEGLVFKGWIGDCTGTGVTCEVRANKDKQVIAVFTSWPAPAAKTGHTNSASAAGGGDDDGALQVGVSWPVPRYTDLGNGVIRDNLTGLQWLKDAACLGQATWSIAFTVIDALNAGDDFSCTDYSAGTHGDWRLPNVNELRSLLISNFIGPAISNAVGDSFWSEGDPFVGIPLGENIWSSSPAGSVSAGGVIASGGVYQLNIGPPVIVKVGVPSNTPGRNWAVRGGAL